MLTSWLLMKEAGERLGLSASMVRWLCDTRRLRCVRTPSGVRLVSSRAVEDLQKRREQEPEHASR